jgi:hypothetical protein
MTTMKKIAIKLAALALLLCCLFSFTSCLSFLKKPELNLEDAEDNLKDEKYSVSYIDDEDDLSVGVTEQLVAINEDDRLYITVYDSAKLAKLAYKGIKLERDMKIKELELRIDSLKHILNKYEDDLKKS